MTVAEPGALVGFLGPKVYEALNGEPFPAGVQTAENLAAKGVLDAVVAAEDLPMLVDRALGVLVDGPTLPRLDHRAGEPSRHLSAWESIEVTRRPDRAGVRELLRYGATGTLRLRGTDEGERDSTMLVALTRLDGQPCVLVGQDRARQSPTSPMGPGALREARRAMRLAEELGMPLVTVIDTPGAELSAHAEDGAFDYADESDKVAYPMPAHPRQEGGGDAHVLIVDKTACRLYELYAAHESGGTWKAGSGAVWNLRSNHLRPDSWTSADAAGLPILPGLVRYDEVAAGVIRHALRFTASRTSEAHIYPARHDAGDSDGSLPPMGLRVRLKASVDISGYGKQARVVLQALKTYGMILADNGSPWYISGASNKHFDDDVLHALGKITGADFEVVDTSHLRNG